MGTLDGKVALVSGSGRGIGRAVAEKLAAEGARVVVNDLDKDAAEEVIGQLRRSGGDAVACIGSVTDPEFPGRFVQTALDSYGRLDIIVNNAGYTWDGPIHKMSDEQFQAMLDIHVVAPFRIIRAAAPHLREPAKKERDEGTEYFRKIVNVSSISGTMGNAGQANYSAAKSAIIGLTKTLAKEWGQFKINVNAVAFGFVETRLTAAKEEAETFQREGEDIQLGIPAQLRAMASAIIPIGRPASPEEAAGGIFFLCSPWSNYIHGQVLNVTGGQFGGMTN
jgi:3-oxoacyl-[acyl-carrier protein] reductase